MTDGIIKLSSTKYVILYICMVLSCTAEITDSSKNKNLSLSGILLPSRAPESGYYLQGGIVGVFKTAQDSLLRASSVYAYGMYSQLHQWRFSLGGLVFSPEEKYNIGFWYFGSYVPEKYFGINEPVHPSRNEFVSYHVLRFETSVLRKIYKKNFVGLIHYMEQISDVSYPKPGILSSSPPLGTHANFCNGLGLIGRHDSRDYLLSTQKGAFAEFAYTLFTNGLGSDYEFSYFKLDLRKFWLVWPAKEHIVATQFFGASAWGQVPMRWFQGIHSRAYHPNLHRGNVTYMAQVEYRFRIWRWFGLGVFGGMAQVGNRFNKMIGSRIYPNYGLSLRAKVLPKYNMYLRIDYGIGFQTSNYYLAFYDAY